MTASASSGITIIETVPGSVQVEATTRVHTPQPPIGGWNGLIVLPLPPASDPGSAHASTRKTQSARSQSGRFNTWNAGDIQAAAAVARAALEASHHPSQPDVTPAQLARQLAVIDIGSERERPRAASVEIDDPESSSDKKDKLTPSPQGSQANSRPGTANQKQRALQVSQKAFPSGRVKKTVSHTITSLSRRLKLETLPLPHLLQIAAFFETAPETSKTTSRFFQSKELTRLFQTSSTMRGRVAQIVVGRLNSTRDIQKAIADSVPIPSFLRYGVRPKQAAEVKGAEVKGISTLHFEDMDLDVPEEESTSCCTGAKNQVRDATVRFSCSDLTALFPHIETLIFNNCNLGKSACLVLEQIPHLKHLTIKNDAKLTDDAIAPRRILLKRLTTLSLDGCQKISNKALHAICQFTANLTELSLAKTKITDLHDILKLAMLQKLGLAGSEGISDESLSAFSESSNSFLKIIDLSQCRLSNAGISHLKMKQLDTVILSGCRPVKSLWSTKSITYAGVIATFLQQHPKVKVVDVTGVLSITSEEKERIEMLLLNKKIKDEDSEAFKRRIKNKRQKPILLPHG